MSVPGVPGLWCFGQHESHVTCGHIILRWFICRPDPFRLPDTISGKAGPEAFCTAGLHAEAELVGGL